MANPVIKVKRSSVVGKVPAPNQLERGELAVNSYDGKVYIVKDQFSVGIATTTTTVNPWLETGVGVGLSYSGDIKVSGISTFGSDKVVVGAAQTQFLVRGNGRVVGVLTVGSGSVTLNDDSVNVGAGTTILTTGFQIGGNGVFVHSTGYNVGGTFLHNAGITGAGANLSGIVTAVGLDVSGNIDIDGTTNLDAVDIDGAVDMASSLTLAGNADFNGNLDVDGTTNLDAVDIDGAVDMASSLTIAGNIDANGDLDVDGTTNLDAVDIDGAVDMASSLTLAGNADFNGNLDVDGTSNLDAVDIDGAVDMASTLTLAGNADFNGNLDVAGISTFENNVNISDNKKLLFGASNDLEIFHQTSNGNSIIKETGGGSLSIQTNGDYVNFWDSTNSVAMAQFQNGGTCTFRHGATIRLQTASAGITVTGNSAVSGNVTAVDATFSGALGVTGNSTFTGRVIANHGVTGNINSAGISTVSGFTFPSTDGTEDQALVTDGSGSLSFKTLSGGGGATGAATTISTGVTTATQGQTAFTAPNVFDDGSQATAFSTQIYLNGVKQRLGASNDYQLSAPQTVNFNSGVTAGDDVSIVVYFGHTLEEEFFTATQGQQNFTLAGSLAASKNYKIFLNGVRLRNTIDYTASAAVVLNQGTDEGDQIDICSDQAEDRLTSTFDGQTNFAPSDSNTTADNMQVYLNGILLRETEDWSIGSPAVNILDALGLTAGDHVDVVVRRS